MQCQIFVTDLLIGAGDKLRGGVLDFVDSATGTGGHHAVADVGDAKMRQGIADTRRPVTTATSTASDPTTGIQPTSATAAGTMSPGSALESSSA